MKTHESDVVVIGGGPAGLGAALASARCGARTVLIESQGCLGGMGTAGLVPAFAPFNYNDPSGEPYIRGIALEIVERLESACGIYPTSKHWKLFDKEIAKLVFDRMVQEAGVRVRFFTTFDTAITSSDRIDAIMTISKSGREAWRAGCYVDCTGDADVAASAGAPVAVGGDEGETMPPTLCFVVGGVDRTKVSDVGPVAEAVLRGKAEGRLTNPEDFRGIRDLYGPDTLGFNYNHIYGADCLDADSLSAAMMEGRRIAHELVEYLRETVDGFQNARIVNTAGLLGVRETRRIVGEFVLKASAYFNSVTHDDDICVYDYAVDLHAAKDTRGSREEYEKLYYRERTRPGEYYGIPYRCLLPSGIANLAVAGRSISCDRAMLASLRVMTSCIATGQAAGCAAALALEQTGAFAKVDVQRLQSALIAAGAYLPHIEKRVVG